MRKHTPLPWSRGRTLLTQDTRRWPKERWDENDKRERTMVFANFHDRDQGRSREFICKCEGPNAEENAELIAKACSCFYDLLEACEQGLVFIEQHETSHGRNFGAGNVLRAAVAKAREGDATSNLIDHQFVAARRAEKTTKSFGLALLALTEGKTLVHVCPSHESFHDWLRRFNEFTDMNFAGRDVTERFTAGGSCVYYELYKGRSDEQ